MHTADSFPKRRVGIFYGILTLFVTLVTLGIGISIFHAENFTPLHRIYRANRPNSSDKAVFVSVQVPMGRVTDYYVFVQDSQKSKYWRRLGGAYCRDNNFIVKDAFWSKDDTLLVLEVSQGKENTHKAIVLWEVYDFRTHTFFTYIKEKNPKPLSNHDLVKERGGKGKLALGSLGDITEGLSSWNARQFDTSGH
jgi:hypothetical protein